MAFSDFEVSQLWISEVKRNGFIARKTVRPSLADYDNGSFVEEQWIEQVIEQRAEMPLAEVGAFREVDG